MKINRRGYISTVLNRLAILAFLGGGIVLLLRHQQGLSNLGPLAALRLLIPVVLALYALLLLDSLRILTSNYMFKRYDPADPESVRDLGRNPRYRVFSPQRLQEDGDALLLRFLQALHGRGYREASRQNFGIVLERPASGIVQSLLGRRERFILIYKPMINVLIAEQHIRDASEYILRAGGKVRRNSLLFLSDMESDAEMLSAAVSVVNAVNQLDQGSILVCHLLDLRHGRLFYPQDNSSQTFADRSYYRGERNFFESVVKAAA